MVVSDAGLTRSLLRQNCFAQAKGSLLIKPASRPGGCHRPACIDMSEGSSHTQTQSAGSAYTMSQALSISATMLVCVTVLSALFTAERLQVS